MFFLVLHLREYSPVSSFLSTDNNQQNSESRRNASVGTTYSQSQVPRAVRSAKALVQDRIGGSLSEDLLKERSSPGALKLAVYNVPYGGDQLVSGSVFEYVVDYAHLDGF
jgi:hypothetical protein